MCSLVFLGAQVILLCFSSNKDKQIHIESATFNDLDMSFICQIGLRIGKGEGFADLEWAMMTAMGAVNKDTVVITTVHDCQIVDIPEKLIEEHDLTVDYVVTQTEIIECKNSRPKPAGIFWSKLEPVKVQKTSM